MSKESVLENLLIYHDNLSVYYLGSVFITVLTVALAWWYNKERTLNIEEASQNSDENCSKLQNQKDESEEETDSNDEIISKIIKGRQSLLAEKVAANMTEDQLKEEKEVEKQQLEAIFQLLQSEEGKFQVSSLEELEDQLKLYRH